MLRRSFQHLPGIRERGERRLWGKGLRGWNELRGFLPPRTERFEFERALDESERALGERDLGWFGRTFPSAARWRLYREFSEQAVYLDIETEGTASEETSPTCIATVSRGGLRSFARGRDLGRFPEALDGRRLLVTFNGAAFDLPILRRTFPEIPFDEFAHFDLCLAFRRLDVRGGLKRIEKDLGVPRDDGLDGLDGSGAVVLWQCHRRGDERALPTLERYCAEDVLGLPALAAKAANALLAQTPFAGELEPMPETERLATDLPYSRELLSELMPSEL